MLFPPPTLKTTIIQLNKDIDPEDNNYEILTNDYSAVNKPAESLTVESMPAMDDQPRKKRRRLLSFANEEELAKRRHETKQLHLIIEKRRRIKINREFEALKYLIPACRAIEATTPKKQLAAASGTGPKIDGMYKLTILKSAVEYIMYLHHVVGEQQQLLRESQPDNAFDVSFATIPLDVNKYRNIDKDFSFSELAHHFQKTMAQSQSSSTTSGTSRAPKSTAMSKASSSRHTFTTIHEVNESEPELSSKPAVHAVARSKSDSYASVGLPTPDVTPDITPILSLLSKYSNSDPTRTAPQKPLPALQPAKTNASEKINLDSLNRAFLFEPRHHGATGIISTLTSPFTIPIKSQVKKTGFSLPDPAILSAAEPAAYPKKMYFKTKVPEENLVAHLGGGLDDDVDDPDLLHDASRVLLTLRKPSIEKLLN